MTFQTVNEKLEDEAWLRRGLGKINDAMRGVQNPEKLSENMLWSLAEYLEADIGSFYLADDQVYLRRSAIFAYSAPDSGGETFSPNEGLIGRAAAQLKTIVLDDVPTDYIKVKSSLGATSPKHLLIVPMTFEGKLNGVLELGALKPFAKGARELLEVIPENIGIAIDLATSRQRLGQLLSQSQELTEALQHQQEEVRAAHEKMTEQAGALQEAQIRLQGQQAALEETNSELELKQQLLEEQKEALQDANALLRESQGELELASKYKSEFLSNMSHELRTPLNSILILGQMLESNKAGRLSEEEVDFSRTIVSAGNDLLALIGDILDLSKIEAGKIDLHLEPVNLMQLIGHLEKMSRIAAEAKGLQLIVSIEADVLGHLFTDQQRLEQILKNFLSNAIKFTKEGSVTIRIWKSTFPKCPIAISVTDSGIGISENKQTMIFDAFTQADGTTARRFGGTGLGLSISRELALLLQGEIGLESKEGEGSTFTLFLPERIVELASEKISLINEVFSTTRSKRGRSAGLVVSPWKTRAVEPKARPPAEASSSHDDRSSLAPGDRILLMIEDEYDFSQILAKQARSRGFKCLLSEDGETGLEDARKYQPSGIILDLKLPGMSGLEVLEQLKNDSSTRHIPVHIVSGSDQRIRSMHMGAVGYLMKPVSMSDLSEAFNRIDSATSKKLRNVLIVEDDERQLALMCTVISEINEVNPVGVQTGESALEVLRAGGVDCLILDLRLPDMSGFDLLELMVADKSFVSPPVVVYTGSELTREDEEKLRRYTDSIIIKGARSPDRLLDETMLFLHRLESDLPPVKQVLLRELRDRDQVFEGIKMLLVDDDMRNVFALSRLLEDKGAIVVVARDGQEALDKLSSNEDIKIVLMDLMMPVMDGFESMRRIRLDKRFVNLPVIALTAKAMKGDQEKCFAAGASDYLSKPIDVKRLLSLVKVWLAPQGSRQ